MARIRSIHPGLATDEAIVTVSIPARYFFVLLLTECDDQGVFEWKPVTLKMRLFPADNVDISALLSELACIDAVRSYEIDGRKLGAVRNFRKFQRPKSPNCVHPMPDDFRNYVGLSGDVSEISDAQPPPVPQNGEKSPQMEEGGWRMKEEDGEESPPTSSARPSDDAALAVEAWNAMAEPIGLPLVQRMTETRKRLISARLRDAGGIEGLRIAFAKVGASPVLRGERNGNGHAGWKADFDFVLRESSFVKLMEGKYDDRQGVGEAPLFGRGSRTGFAAAAAELERRLEERDRGQPQPGPDA